MPERELNESGENGTVTGIIFSKRKGGILEASWDQEFFRYLRTEIPVPWLRPLITFWNPFWDPKFGVF